MIKRSRLIILCCVLLPAFPAAAAPSDTPASLRECYDWARERSESLKSRQEDIVQSKARARAALGSALPRVEWNLNDTWQDPNGVDKLEQKGFSGFVQKDQVESKFSVHQPLFSGLREWSARAGFQRESARDALLLDKAGRDLFEATAAAFYAVLGREAGRDNTVAALKLAQDRVRELSGFRRLGKSRESEVFSAQARAAALKAQLSQNEASIAAAREDLSYITGQDLSGRPLLDEIPSPPPAGPLSDALARAKDRTDLRAQREDAAAKRLRIRYERGSYWPTADVTGNYYTKRVAFMNDIGWDVALSLNVPIYQGGAVAARVREADSAWRQSVLTLEQMERDVVHTVRTAHGDLSGAVDAARALEDAARAAQKSYDSVLSEYHLGLVTNLEVLQALDLLVAEKSAADAARFEAKRLYVHLNVAVEALP